MKLNVLVKDKPNTYAASIAKEFNVQVSDVKLLFQLLEKKKVDRAYATFKRNNDKFALQGNRYFLLIEAEMGNFFFFNMQMSLIRKDLNPRLGKITKALTEAEKNIEKAIQEEEKKGKDNTKKIVALQNTIDDLLPVKAFIEFVLEKIKGKWSVSTGIIKRTSRVSDDPKEIFFKKAGKIEGTYTTTEALGNAIANIGFDLYAVNNEKFKIDVTANDDDVIEEDSVTDTPPIEEDNEAKQRKKQRKAEHGDINLELSNMSSLTNMKGIHDDKKYDRMQNRVNELNQRLADLIIEAREDGVITPKEQASIDKLRNKISDLELRLTRRIQKLKIEAGLTKRQVTQMRQVVLTLLGRI